MKKFFLFLSTLSLFALSSCANTTDVRPVARAFDEEETSEVIESSQPETETTHTSKLDWIEEKVVPIIGGIGGIDLLVCAYYVTMSIIKYKGSKTRDKKNDEKIVSIEKKIKEQDDAINGLTTAINNNTAAINNFVELFTKGFAANSEKTDGFIKASTVLLTKIEEQNAGIVKVTKLKDVIEASCGLTAKALAFTDAAVKSGVAEEALKLVETLKGGDSDGKKE